MADTYNKKEREKKKSQKKKEKQARKDTRKDEGSGSSWESMIAYVDENGNIIDTPPDPSTRKVIDAEKIELGVPKREEEDPFLYGIINFFDTTKGFGFIKNDEDENFFFHQNNITGVPVKGKKVRFEKEKSPKGWNAVRITIE